MNNILLNYGCSFSSPTRFNLRGADHVSYCEYIPGEIYNIAVPGNGIWLKHIQKFLEDHWWTLHPTKKPITHFLYQVPSPSRQLLHSEIVDEEQFLKLPIMISLKNKPDDYSNNRYKYKLKSLLEIKQDASILKHKQKFYKKALLEVDRIVNLVRSYYPNIKITFLKYEESGRKLVYEFSKDWFKTDLTNYCKNNNITYINKDNFHTRWFRENNYTADKNHPNKDGAKYIADKILKIIDF